MPYRVNKDRCVSCGTCEGECPIGALKFEDDFPVIDANLCAECGACADACPCEAIEQY